MTRHAKTFRCAPPPLSCLGFRFAERIGVDESTRWIGTIGYGNSESWQWAVGAWRTRDGGRESHACAPRLTLARLFVTRRDLISGSCRDSPWHSSLVWL